MIINTFYSVDGEVMGMPVIRERGLCTNEDSTLNALRRYENEEIQLSRVRRRSGLIVKSLTGDAVETQTVADEQIGRFPNCIQLGKTRTAFAFPKQPSGFGPHAGKMILQYERVWVQISA